jgi:hypothetical protein
MRNFLLLMLILVLVAFIGVYSYFDYIIKRAVETYGSEAIGLQLRVSNVRINPSLKGFSITGIKIANPKEFDGGSLIEIKSLDVVADLWSLYFDKLMYFSAINVNALEINYKIKDGSDNFSIMKRMVGKSNRSSNAEKKDRKIAIKLLHLDDTVVKATINELVTKEIKLSKVSISDIGVKNGGVTVENALKQVVDNISFLIAEANLSSLINQLLNLDNLNDAIKPKIDKGIDDATESLKSLLPKL